MIDLHQRQRKGGGWRGNEKIQLGLGLDGMESDNLDYGEIDDETYLPAVYVLVPTVTKWIGSYGVNNRNVLS
jgi:hypothetical protein